MTKTELVSRLKKDAAENKFILDGEYIVFSKASNLSYHLLTSMKLGDFLTANPVSITRLNVALLVTVEQLLEAGFHITVRASYRSPEYDLTTFGCSDSCLYTKGDALSLGVPSKELDGFTNLVKSIFTPGEIGLYSWGVHIGRSKEPKEWDKRADTSINQKIKDFLSYDKMKNILLLAAAAGAGWFFFLRKK